jgi:hypothetical protein
MTCLVAGGSETWEDIGYGQWSWSPGAVRWPCMYRQIQKQYFDWPIHVRDQYTGRILAGFMHLGYARLCNGLVLYRPGWEGVQHIHQLKMEQVSKFHAYHVNYLNLDGVRAWRKGKPARLRVGLYVRKEDWRKPGINIASSCTSTIKEASTLSYTCMYWLAWCHFRIQITCMQDQMLKKLAKHARALQRKKKLLYI